jgi:hypothetical protein
VLPLLTFDKFDKSTVVEHLCRHPKVKGLLAANAGVTWRKKMVKMFSSKVFVP